MQGYTLTIKIAEGGTKHISNKGVESNSFAGHMWYSLSDGNKEDSYGFNSGEDKAKPFGEGKVTSYDDKAYQDTYYTVQVQLTKEEYEKLQEFGKNPKENGFPGSYNVLTNSCVDFTWKAMEHAGMNDKKNQGNVFPKSNISKVDEVAYEHMFGSKEEWKETWDKIHKESRHIVYGNADSNIVTGSDKNEVFYAGKGDDVVFGGRGDDTYIYTKGDGNLAIQDNGFDKNDRLIIQGFNSEDAVFTLSEDKKDLSIAFGNEGDSITIKDYQNGGEIENLTFDDKELNAKDIEDKLQEQYTQQENQIYDNEDLEKTQENEKIENLASDDNKDIEGKLQDTQQTNQIYDNETQENGKIENLASDDKGLDAKDAENKLQEQYTPQESQAYDNEALQKAQENDGTENLASNDKELSVKDIGDTQQARTYSDEDVKKALEEYLGKKVSYEDIYATDLEYKKFVTEYEQSQVRKLEESFNKENNNIYKNF